MEPTKCSFFNPKKNRQCKFDVVDGQFCIFHSEQLVPCPIDPSHSIQSRNVDKHVKICNKLKEQQSKESQNWYSQNVNKKVKLDIDDNQSSINDNNSLVSNQIEKKMILKMTNEKSEVLMQCLQKIESGYQKALEQIESYYKSQNYQNIDRLIEMLQISASRNDMKNQSYKQKDLDQVGLLLSLLEKYHLLSGSHLYIEFGAGKGNLSHQLKQKLKDSSHLLLEIEARRHKFDKYHRNDEFYKRIRTDISHFDINQIDQVIDKQSDKIVGISKHLCGRASDIAIQSMMNYESQSSKIGMALGTCCHQQCRISEYANQQYLEDLGFTLQEQSLLFGITSWAITKWEDQKVDNQQQQQQQQQNVNQLEKFYEQLDSHSKTIYGYKAKRIIDIGRALHLSKNHQIVIEQYCDISLSPENLVIMVI